MSYRSHALSFFAPVVIAGGLFAACSSSSNDASPPAAPNPTVDVSPDTDPDASPSKEGPTDPDGSPTKRGPTDAGRDAYVDPSVTSAIKKYDTDYAAAVCVRLTACCTAPADYGAFFERFLPDSRGRATPPYTLLAVPSAASCAKELAEQLNLLHSQWGKSVTDNRMKYDLARAQRCVSDVTAAACGPALAKALFPRDKGDGCLDAHDNEVFTKFLKPGAACSDIKDTTFFGECDPAFGFCDGKACVAWRRPGETCSVTPRLFCLPDNPRCGTGDKCPTPPVLAGLDEACLTSDSSYRDCQPAFVPTRKRPAETPKTGSRRQD